MEKKHGCGCFILTWIVIIVVVFGIIALATSFKSEDGIHEDPKKETTEASDVSNAETLTQFEPATYEAAYNRIKTAEETIKKKQWQ